MRCCCSYYDESLSVLVFSGMRPYDTHVPYRTPSGLLHPRHQPKRTASTAQRAKRDSPGGGWSSRLASEQKPPLRPRYRTVHNHQYTTWPNQTAALTLTTNHRPPAGTHPSPNAIQRAGRVTGRYAGPQPPVRLLKSDLRYETN